MKRIKVIVCFAFVAGILAFGLFKSDAVMGRPGGSSLAAPTNFSASDNLYNTKIGLYWDTIRGATTYRIFRNTTNDPGTATDVGTTASNSFFDSPYGFNGLREGIIS